MSVVFAALIDAARLIKSPVEFYSAFSFASPLKNSVRAVLFWGILGGVFDYILNSLGVRTGPEARGAGVAVIVLAPLIFLFVVAAMSSCFWLLFSLLGLPISWKNAFRALSAFGPVLVLEVLLGPILIFRTALIGAKFALACVAAEQAFKLPQRKARLAFGILGSLSAAYELVRAF